MRIVLALIAMLLIGETAQAERRLALVIANQDYPADIGALSATHRDARLVSDALTSIGFEVTPIFDANAGDMAAAISDFEIEISSAAERGENVVAFFYASMHGASLTVNNRNRNFLIPARETIRTRGDLIRKGVRMDQLIEGLSVSGAKAVFVVSDACRNTLKKSFNKSGVKGFGQEKTGNGMLVAYATAPGSTTPDDGLFAEILARELKKSGRRASIAMFETVEAVASERSIEGQPFLSSGGLPQWLCFNGCSAAPPPSPTVILADDEGTALAQAITAGTLEAYTAFKRRFPRHERIAFVDSEIRRLTPRPTEPVSGSRSPGSVFRDRLSGGGEGPEMVVVPAGSFMMGSPSSEVGRNVDESPQRRVTISKPFAVGKFEVTWAEWEACVVDGGCNNSGPASKGGDEDWGKGNRPVINVSWEDAQAYVKWLSGKTGEDYGLLSEAQWEYAARAGSTGRFSWGEGDPTCTKGRNNSANFRSCSSDRTEPVGYSAANAFGLHDMHGNVWEWVDDCYVDFYIGGPTDGSALTSGACTGRVFRGGSWVSLPQRLRSASRLWNSPGYRGNFMGFRVTRDLSE